jgi:hypothetical protein
LEGALSGEKKRAQNCQERRTSKACQALAISTDFKSAADVVVYSGTWMLPVSSQVRTVLRVRDEPDGTLNP